MFRNIYELKNGFCPKRFYAYQVAEGNPRNTLSQSRGQRLLPIPQHKAFPSGEGIEPKILGPAGYSFRVFDDCGTRDDIYGLGI
jgi:hypothetical protein